MVIKDWDSELVVTDNVLTNLPISRLSSVPIDAGGVRPDDLMLISKRCDDPQMTETGYMSYQRRFSDIAAWAASALGVDDIVYAVGRLSDDVGGLLPYAGMVANLSGETSASLGVYDDHSVYNPYIVSAIYQTDGAISRLSGYRLSTAVDNLMQVHKFTSVSAATGAFDNIVGAEISSDRAVYAGLSVTNALSAASAAVVSARVESLSAEKLVVGGVPYSHLSAMPEAEYARLQQKRKDCFYFTY
jgi:hypothetical protein